MDIAAVHGGLERRMNSHFGQRMLRRGMYAIQNPREIFGKLRLNWGVIAELGCGSGFYSKHLLRRATLLYCVDPNHEYLGILKKHIKSDKMRIHEESADATTIPDKSVDTVFLANSFHDMQNRRKVVAEINRIIKSDGVIVVIDWKKERSEIGPPYNIRMSDADYSHYFSSFKVRKKFEAGRHHFGIVLVEKT